MVTLTIFSSALLSQTQQPIWRMVWAIKRRILTFMQEGQPLTTQVLYISRTTYWLVLQPTSLKYLVSAHKSKRAPHQIVSQRGARQLMADNASKTLVKSLSWTMPRRRRWLMDSTSQVLEMNWGPPKPWRSQNHDNKLKKEKICLPGLQVWLQIYNHFYWISLYLI